MSYEQSVVLRTYNMRIIYDTLLLSIYVLKITDIGQQDEQNAPKRNKIRFHHR